MTATYRPTIGAPAPADPDTRRLAAFVATLAHHHCFPAGARWRVATPEVVWLDPAGDLAREKAGAGRRLAGLAHDDLHQIALANNLAGRELVQTVLHEVRHLHQRPGEAVEARERDAEAYARRFAPVFLRAYHAAAGDAARVALRAGGPPWYGLPRGTVVLTRAGRLYDYDPRRTGAAWREVRS